MGNVSDYDLVEEKTPSALPEVFPFHRKGKPYGVILDYKLKSIKNTELNYWSINDLRSGNPTWGLGVSVYGDVLNFEFVCVKKNKDKYDVTDRFPLHYSSRSNRHMTVLKGRCGFKSVVLELCADNIHSQRLDNLKLEKSFIIWGFVAFDDQDKIPIAF